MGCTAPSYLKAHPGVTEHERKRLCRAVDCGDARETVAVSREVRTHAAQRVAAAPRRGAQVLLSEQQRWPTPGALGKVGKEDDVNVLRLEV